MPTSAPDSSFAKSISFLLSEECNFRCTYCYLVHKNDRRKMTFEVARGAIDHILEHREIFSEGRVSWDFGGGEPLLELDLIERIVDHIQERTYVLSHPWFTQRSFGLTTNGALYDTPAVRRFVARYGRLVGMSMTIDGPRHVHDRARVDASGRGTFDRVVANVPKWLSDYPGATTKVTLSHETLPSLAESVLFIFGLGIREVHANVVFENAWRDGDDEILEEQLDALSEAMISRGLWREHRCSFFASGIGRPMPIHENGNWCGSGRMLAIDADGRFYPCNRFAAYALARKEALCLGSAEEGLDLNRLRPFLALTRTAQSSDECIRCEVAKGCAWCQGFNYDDADTPTIYQRATHICRMHKARVRANDRHFARIAALEAVEGQ